MKWETVRPIFLINGKQFIKRGPKGPLAVKGAQMSRMVQSSLFSRFTLDVIVFKDLI